MAQLPISYRLRPMDAQEADPPRLPTSNGDDDKLARALIGTCRLSLTLGESRPATVCRLPVVMMTSRLDRSLELQPPELAHRSMPRNPATMRLSVGRRLAGA
ncbi:MAG: hypothetical protein P4L50_15860, partial [Anaerolineaceae bacterium]|nr:hypothetical protein [Anaerolineaceae bacterium]